MKPVKKKNVRNSDANDQQQKKKAETNQPEYIIQDIVRKEQNDAGVKTSPRRLSRTVTVVRVPIGERRRVEAECAESAFERCFGLNQTREGEDILANEAGVKP